MRTWDRVARVEVPIARAAESHASPYPIPGLLILTPVLVVASKDQGFGKLDPRGRGLVPTRTAK
jgi:hypothetical protein